MKQLILIIESDVLVRLNLFGVLEHEDFNIISSEDGLFGLRLAEDFQPDLIICGINTPHVDGYRVLRNLRANLTIAKIPCIFLTSEIEPDSYYRTQQLGADDYLTKPVHSEKLLEAISRQLKKAQNQ